MSSTGSRSLFYANLPADGRHLENAAYHELKEFKKFLQTARNFQRDEVMLRVGWELDGQVRRDHSQAVRLIPCADRPEEADETFDEFLSPDTEFIYECASPSASAERRERRSFLIDEHKIKVVDRRPSERRLLLERIPSHPELAIRPNTYSLDKQIESIDRLRAEPALEHVPLLRLVQQKGYADRHWPRLEAVADPEWKVLTDQTRDGTLEQREFVCRALATPDFAFLEGPPGSGKTTAICELILQLVARGKRVLLSASTHVAVDNVLERVADGSHNEIVAVRIDRRDQDETPESVIGLRLEKFVESERKRLRDAHRQVSNPSPAQRLFRHALDSAADGERMVERLILDSANLVAGTTIGVLQHPDLKSARRSKHPEPPFDMLIVDEASKTTFQEFLVPALWAKRWVLVGDPRQLSPYADEEDLGPNIRACLPVEWERDACLLVAQASWENPRRRGKSLVTLRDPFQAPFLQRQAEARGLDTGVAVLNGADANDGPLRALRLAETAIIAGDNEDFARLESEIPLDISRLNGSFNDTWHRRSAAWLDYADIEADEQLLWENEIAWRLAREYELRWLPASEQPDYSAKIQQLMPADKEARVLEGVRQVGRLALPSVLESLMRGVGIRNDSRFATALSSGLSPEVYGPRAQRLTYQHRMHGDISAMPRKLFYEGQALHDAKGMSERRTWECDCFGDCRAVWIPVEGRTIENRNEKEAGELCRQLDRFLKWAESKPRKDGHPWEVAVLTFYRGQEALIRNLLDRNRGIKRTGFGSYEVRHQKAATIKLCTVDRFQGHEADVVFLSFVQTKKVGFLQSPNRLNVALTRARYQLVLVGARRFFESGRCKSHQLRELARLPANIPFPQ